MRAAARLLALGAAMAGAAGAGRAETLVVSLSTERIAITSNFTGATLVVFGVIDRDGPPAARDAYDVVVTVRGPRGAVTVREKARWGPFWFNADSRKYIAIPALVSVLSNRPLTEIAAPQTRRALLLGLDPLVPAQGDRLKTSDPDEPAFRAALLRIRRAERLFGENEEGVRFIAPGVFRANARLPGAAPLGAYAVDVVVLSEGREIAKSTTPFVVTKSGVEDQIASAARQSPWLYGGAAILLALAMGWLASVIFRRD